MSSDANKRARIPVPLGGNARRWERRIGIGLLGSTGSIGRQTLEVVAAHPDRFRIVTMSTRANAALLVEQARVFQPELVAIEDAARASSFDFPCLSGEEGLVAAATHPEVDIVIVATSGHAAIGPTAKAVETGKVVALANKEAIVCAGEIIVALASKHGAEIRPVDSEHSAIWQALGISDGSDISRLILTASGGPFREFTIDQLSGVTVQQALAHPTWDMGGKITIDSATMMNKGLELIEAHWLFGIPFERIEVVVHPESVIHSLVEFADRGQIAQLSLPDMRLPIQFALTYPEHASSEFKRLSLTEIGALRFMEPDLQRFPALRLAREAGEAGGTAPTVLSAADDVAVAAFVDGKIGFRRIAEIVDRVLDQHEIVPAASLEAITEADRWARSCANSMIGVGNLATTGPARR